MTRDLKETDSEHKGVDWIDRELQRFFQQYEGDAHARTRSRRSRLRVLGLAFAAAFILAVATAIVVQTTSQNGNRSRRAQEASCAAQLRFRGVLYLGEGLAPNAALKRGRALGDGALPLCNDTQVPNQAPVPPSSEERVALVSLDGIAPSIAVARADQEDMIFVAGGRCAGYDPWVARLGCLRERLMFGGRSYTATRLRTIHVDTGAVIGSGRVGAKDVVVRRVNSVSEDQAVATEPGGSVIYLSDQGCFVSPGLRSFERDLLACLTTGRD
jgi:hypothetical protein